ncbi:ATP synthase F0 subunit B [Desulfuromonas sp. AOP6]|uniref:F0F1 ATP synthase subunit B family protein n=1 Tax=Desulfuromonas sp. AOP6 TaxID=1566351 RepID=UPI0012DCAC56|nr:ATP synthase F0 subunit B [Desulfuromonas sp. AOP6]
MNKKVISSAAALLLIVCSTTAAVAAGDAHHVDSGVLIKDFLYRTFNFAVTFGLLAYFVTKPIRKGLAGRREGIEKALKEAQDAKEKAETRYAEYDEKLTKASAEIEDIYASIKREGELERDRIIAEAKAMAEKISQDAEKTASREIAKAKAELRQEATNMAIEIARDLLTQKVTGDDQKRLVNEYIQKVGELH